MKLMKYVSKDSWVNLKKKREKKISSHREIKLTAKCESVQSATRIGDFPVINEKMQLPSTPKSQFAQGLQVPLIKTSPP